jgi:hypothetical protein
MKKWVIWLIVIIVLLGLLFAGFTLIARQKFNAATDNIEICDCSSDNYNCGDFSSQEDAQSCYDYCIDETGRDIHQLDNDGDGVVCESLK